MVKESIDEIKECLLSDHNFALEAGAGAGKTHALMQCIDFLQSDFINVSGYNSMILCITYTNVAKDEILGRLRSHDNIVVNTLHEFLWDFIKNYQIELKKAVMQMINKEKEKLQLEIDKAQKLIDKPRKDTKIEDKKKIITNNAERLTKFNNPKIENICYKNYRAIYRGVISHDDIINIAINFLQNEVFSKIFINSFTHIFIDEFQDTKQEILLQIMKSVKYGKIGRHITIGLFGDEMQRIYSNVPLSIDYGAFDIRQIPKLENYRSCEEIIKANNCLRGDKLIQEYKNPNIKFEKLLFVYNLSSDKYLKGCTDINYEKYKRLFLSHKHIAEEVGFSSISNVFSDEYGRHSNDKLLKLEDPFIDIILKKIVAPLYEFKKENAVAIISNYNKAFFSMFDLSELKNKISEQLGRGKTLNDIIDFYDKEDIRKNTDIEKIIKNYKEHNRYEFIENLLRIEIKEYIKLYKQINNETDLDTLHGVKGAEFHNVMVNIMEGQPWTQYNFDTLFTVGRDGSSSVNNAHKLFYVACTRAKEALVINYISNTYDEENVNLLLKNIQYLFQNLIEVVVKT